MIITFFGFSNLFYRLLSNIGFPIQFNASDSKSKGECKMTRFVLSLFAATALLAASYLSLSHHQAPPSNPTVQVADGADCFPGEPCIIIRL
jgi:hypothetical protein